MKSNKKKTIIIAVTSTVVGAFAIIGAFVVFNHKTVDATNDTSTEIVTTVDSTETTEVITTEFVDNTTEEVEVITTEETVTTTEDIVESTTENIFNKIKESNITDSTEKVTERPTERTTEKVTEKPVERTTEKATEKKPVETKTTEKATEKPVETKTTEKPVETKPETRTTEKATEKPVETKTTEKPASHTHSYTSKVTKAATCTAAGTKTYTCSCGDSYTETIKATGHKWGNTGEREENHIEKKSHEVKIYVLDDGTVFYTKEEAKAAIEEGMKNDIPGRYGYHTEYKTIVDQEGSYDYVTYHKCKNCGAEEIISTEHIVIK